MSKKNSEKEIEEAQKKARGEPKSEEKKPEQKKDSEKLENTLEKKEVQESEKSEAQSAEEQLQAEEGQKVKKGVDLEELTRGAQPIPAEIHDSPYVEQLSQKPMAEIYKEIKDIYKTAEDKGYLSTLEQKQVLYLNSAVERKIEDEEQGIYSFSEEAARAASVTQHLSASMMGTYKGKKMNELYHR